MTIRAAQPEEYDAVAEVWMRSWLSVGIETPTEGLLAALCERIPREIENGWSLHVADDQGRLAATLAFRLRDCHLDQLFIAPEYQGRGLGKRLLAFTRKHLPDEIWLRCAKQNERAWRWYEREGFVLEKQEPHPQSGLEMKYYRWNRKDAS